jgi:hypothetical protein
MKTSRATCSECGAGFRRIELELLSPSQGVYQCPVCGNVLETFDGDAFVAHRLTIEPLTIKKRCVTENCDDVRLGYHVSPLLPRTPLLGRLFC